MKILRWLDAHFEEVLLAILLIVIACVSFLQVVIRKLPFIPALTWAEEFCRFCWVWSVFLSLPYTLRMSNMLRVTALLDILPEKIMKVLNISVYIITTLCMAVLAFYSVIVVGDIYKSNELSPAMLWPMWAVYSVMIFGFVLAVVRGIQQVCIHTMHFHDKELNTAEQTMMDARYETLNAKGGDAEWRRS
ncbi:MAG: TRAP transporter small permease [Peptococcaceae bacterium]